MLDVLELVVVPLRLFRATALLLRSLWRRKPMLSALKQWLARSLEAVCG
jgi:hypothetical protein